MVVVGAAVVVVVGRVVVVVVLRVVVVVLCVVGVVVRVVVVVGGAVGLVMITGTICAAAVGFVVLAAAACAVVPVAKGAAISVRAAVSPSVACNADSVESSDVPSAIVVPSMAGSIYAGAPVFSVSGGT